VKVGDESRPVVLGLTAYEKPWWVDTQKSGVKGTIVIPAGYHSHRLRQDIMAEILIETYIYDPSPTHRHISGIGKATHLFIHTKVLPDV